jgi:fumarate reductase subunit D
MTDALLVVIILLQLKVLHNQQRSADPNTESFALWLIKAILVIVCVVFLVWAYAHWIR